MLPCQANCPHFYTGCHKNCSAWADFQRQQALERQQQKAYLKFYDSLCAQVTRQYRAMQSRRPVW